MAAWKLGEVIRGVAGPVWVGVIAAVGVLLACDAEETAPDADAAPGDMLPAERVLVGVAWGHTASADGQFLYLPRDGAIVQLDLTERSVREIVPREPGQIVGPRPIASPDGSRIAYLKGPEGLGWSGLSVHITDLRDGSTTVVEPDVVADPEAWFPDGRALLVADDDGPGMRILDLETGRTRQIVPPEAMDGVTGAKLSPDGRWVIWEAGWTIRIAPTSGGQFWSLIDTGNSVGPVWSPDGRFVLYANDQSGSLDLWAVRVVNGEAQGPPRRLLSDVGPVRSLGLSAAGDLLQVRYGNHSQVFTVEFDPRTLAFIDEPRSIAGSPSRAGSWSPGGDLLAYVTRKSLPGDPPDYGTWRPAIRNLETGQDEIFDLGELPGRFYPQTPKWSPDGSRVLFGDPDRGLYVRDVRSGEGRWLFRSERDEPEGFHAIGWMGDGETVLYAHSVGDHGLWPTSEHALSIRTRHLVTGDERVVWTGQGSFDPGKSRLSWSRDRMTLLENFDTEDRRAFVLSVLDLESGALKEVYRSSGRHDEVTAWGGHDWLPGDGHLVTIRYRIDPGGEWTREPQENEFWALPLDGRPPVRMGSVALEPGDEAFGARRIDVHRSEHRIAFTAGGSIKETWLVQGVLGLLPRE